MTVLAGSEGFWKYEVEEPGEPEDDIPIGAGKLYLESKENCLRLHTAMGDAAVGEDCRRIRKLRDSARAETSMVQIARSYSEGCCDIQVMLV